MKQTVLFLSLALATGAAPAAMLPGDSAQGKAVHDQHCTACHDSSVYTRKTRNVKSVEGLIGQANGCVKQLGLKLTKDQVNDLVKYLDESYYKFP